MKEYAAAAIGLLSALTSCCICCFVPGIVMIITANAEYGHWDAVPANVSNTTYCGTLRRRELQTVGRDHYESKIQLVEQKNTMGSNHQDVGVTGIQSFLIKTFENGKLFKREDHDMVSGYDDSDDEIHDSQAAARKPSSSSSQATYYHVYTSHKRIANRKALSRRRHLQQHFPSVPELRTNIGGDELGGGGAAGGYYAGSRHNRHLSSSSDGPQYSVTYSFFTNDGQNITATTEYCTSPAPAVGATEMVLYDPSSPSVGVVSERYYDSTYGSGWGMKFFGLVATVIFGVGLYQALRSLWETCSETTYNTNNANNANTTNTTNNTNSNAIEIATTNDFYSDNPHGQVENP